MQIVSMVTAYIHNVHVRDYHGGVPCRSLSAHCLLHLTPHGGLLLFPTVAVLEESYGTRDPHKKVIQDLYRWARIKHGGNMYRRVIRIVHTRYLYPPAVAEGQLALRPVNSLSYGQKASWRQTGRGEIIPACRGRGGARPLVET
jgi:hypothetical protein